MKLLVVVLALAAAPAVAACGEKNENAGPPGTQKLSVVLDYLPNPDHVGLYAAQKRGDFKRAGLDVSLKVPPDPSSPLKLLAAGKADFAISYEPEVLLARDRGLQLVSVAAIAQRPLTSIMALGSKNVRTPADLAGKTVGTAGIPYQSAYLKTIEQRSGVNPSSVKEVDVGFNLVPAMLSGKADATLGAFWNIEGVQLARQGKHPSIIRMDQAGVPTYDELVLVARRSDLNQRAGLMRRFLRALGHGYEFARRDPVAATDELVKANPDLNQATSLAQVRASLPVFFPPKGKPFGFADPASWQSYGEWMFRNKLVTRPPNAGDALTNEFLPGQGL
ncbi:MAG TPA: ABC transporter substrate-binding protein [Solirubrobacteraceae bacterium]|jgi:putative hydroxymethylpyrimidine transport system substrate-binding protein|nr:ABC transporter substrate-binding protein [Solirubrobacteraceae bacterium]